jgi:hypothetical protein
MHSSKNTAISHTFALFSAICVIASGCADRGLLDRSLGDTELPVDQPASPYPTAIRNSKAAAERLPGVPAAMASTAADEAAAPQLENQQPINAQANQPAQREYAPPLQTPLAVIPPQLVRVQANRAANTLATNTANVQTANVHQLQTLADLAPASNWTPPAMAQASISDLPETTLPTPTVPVAVPSVKPTANAVQLAAATSAITDQPVTGISEEERRQRVERARVELLDALETEIKQRRLAGGSDPELPRLEQQLRLAYVAAGRLDDASNDIESLDETQREAFKNLMFGLGVWLSPDESQRVPLRSAKVLHSLRDATNELASAGKLEVKNLAFCERVDHFGWYSEFPRKEFQPKQQVILYAEVENFSAEHKGPTGYETELQGSYVILDASGQEVASRQLQLDKEVCRNHRRDYFLAYRIYMPDGISPGRYRLELTVEDLKARGKYQGRKLGEGVIEFAVR